MAKFRFNTRAKSVAGVKTERVCRRPFFNFYCNSYCSEIYYITSIGWYELFHGPTCKLTRLTGRKFSPLTCPVFNDLYKPGQLKQKKPTFSNHQLLSDEIQA